jgi:hypothetical protein
VIVDEAYNGYLNNQCKHDPDRTIQIDSVLIHKEGALGAERPQTLAKPIKHVKGSHVEVLLVVSNLVKLSRPNVLVNIILIQIIIILVVILLLLLGNLPILIVRDLKWWWWWGCLGTKRLRHHWWWRGWCGRGSHLLGLRLLRGELIVKVVKLINRHCRWSRRDAFGDEGSRFSSTCAEEIVWSCRLKSLVCVSLQLNLLPGRVIVLRHF